jgi:hypothetical protein
MLRGRGKPTAEWRNGRLGMVRWAQPGDKDVQYFTKMNDF